MEQSPSTTDPQTTAHTPGPWWVDRGSADWGMPCAHTVFPADARPEDFERVIAEVPSITPYCAGASRHDRDRAAVQLANVRLIAAAPDLLEALESCAEALECTAAALSLPTEGAQPKAVADDTYGALPALREARAAIAKATGADHAKP